MKKTIALFASAVVLAAAGLPARADDFGSAADARAMLDKAVAAVKADKSAALTQFAKGEGGFRDRDLYPFCGGADGNFSAHPTLTGKSMKDLQDKAGQPFGAKFYEVAKEGQVAEVGYMWPRPGSTDPVKKVSLVTKVGDQVCAVGYYK